MNISFVKTVKLPRVRDLIPGNLYWVDTSLAFTMWVKSEIEKIFPGAFEDKYDEDDNWIMPPGHDIMARTILRVDSDGLCSLVIDDTVVPAIGKYFKHLRLRADHGVCFYIFDGKIDLLEGMRVDPRCYSLGSQIANIVPDISRFNKYKLKRSSLPWP